VVSFRRFFSGRGLLEGRFREMAMNAVTSLNMVSISREPDQKVMHQCIMAYWALCSGIRADRYSDSDSTLNAITRCGVVSI